MGKFWLILSRHLSSVVWCMSENFTLAYRLTSHAQAENARAQALHLHRSKHRRETFKLLWTKPEATVTEIRCWISHNKLQLDLRGLHPWTLNKSALDNTPHPPHLYVCVCIYVSFRPYLLMETSEALDLLYIFNAVKLSFLSTVCC